MLFILWIHERQGEVLITERLTVRKPNIAGTLGKLDVGEIWIEIMRSKLKFLVCILIIYQICSDKKRQSCKYFRRL